MAPTESKRIFANWANLISVSRIILLLPALYGLSYGLPLISAVSYAGIILSDILDGVVARKTATPSPYGTLIDHGSDAIVVVILTAYFSHRGLFNPLLPILITIAFLHYAFDSRRQSNNPGPRPSRLGRVNGIGYFIFVAVCICAHHGSEYYSIDVAKMVTEVIRMFAWLLLTTTSLSIWQRTRLQ